MLDAELSLGNRHWWAKSRTRIAILILSLLTLASGIASFALLVNGEHALAPSSQVAYSLLGLNLTLLIALSILIFRKIARVIRSRRARLHARVVMLFTLVTVIPTLLVAIFSIAFFRIGVQNWFSDQVGDALEGSVKVAESYLSEHKQIIRADAILIANDLNREAPALIQNPALFNRMIPLMAGIRKVPEALVIQWDRGRAHILGRTPFSYALEFALDDISPDALARAREGEVVILTDDQEDRVRAFIKLESYIDTYLLVGRFVDSKIINYMENTRGSVSEYNRLKSNLSSIQLQFLLLFSILALVMLLIVVWAGLLFAGRLMGPVGDLARVTQKLKTGDLTARVEEKTLPKDEIGMLGKAFNEMAGQLERQRNQLIDINQQIDARRRFSEAVLAGVSAGVLAITPARVIGLSNRSAQQLLEMEKHQLEGQKLATVLPELLALLEDADQNPDQESRREVTLKREKQRLVLLARAVKDEKGYILTFDDITELQTAQRAAAWADVARRIAHEIKNPLTPIQLAAERLKRKYLKEVTSEPETFIKYTDTISRHVTDIGRMVEEFVQFARMPAPSLTRIDLSPLLQDAAFSQKVATSNIEIRVEVPRELLIRADKGQLSQLFTNLLKNASESIEARLKDAPSPEGEIRITARAENGQVIIHIRDNGGGFPEELMDRLTEPYVTTRSKGTGLGLAIVRKIMDDHNGKLVLSNILDKNGAVSGAEVTLMFKVET